MSNLKHKKQTYVGKTLHKLMNNHVYGKTIETLRKRIDVKLVSNEKEYLKHTTKPTYISQKNGEWFIHKSKVTLTHTKPAYVGMRILDSTK